MENHLEKLLKEGSSVEKLKKLLEDLDKPSTEYVTDEPLDIENKDLYTDKESVASEDVDSKNIVVEADEPSSGKLNSKIDIKKSQEEESRADMAKKRSDLGKAIATRDPEEIKNKKIDVMRANAEYQEAKKKTNLARINFSDSKKIENAPTANKNKNDLEIEKTKTGGPKMMNDSKDSLPTFKVKIINPEGAEQTLDIVAASEEEASKKVLSMVNIQPSNIVSIETKENLEPTIPAPEKPEDYNDTTPEGDVNMDKKQPQTIEETLNSVFSLLRSRPLVEELGDAAAEPVATSDETPTELVSDAENKDVYPADEHKQSDEVKEVVVESLGDAAAEPVATSDNAPTELSVSVDNADVYPTDEHKQSDEVKEVVVESLGDAAAEPVATSDETPTELSVSVDNADVFPADEHKQSDEVKEVVVESSIADRKIATPKHWALKNIFWLIMFGIVGISVSHLIQMRKYDRFYDTMTALKSKDPSFAKLYAKIEKKLANKSALNKDDKAELKLDIKNARLQLKDRLRDQKQLLKQAKIDAGRGRLALAESVLDQFDRELISIYEEIIAEELGDAAAEPVATSDEAPTELSVSVDNADVYPTDEHKQSDEVREIMVEEYNELDDDDVKSLAKISKDLKDAGKVKKADSEEDIKNKIESNKNESVEIDAEETNHAGSDTIDADGKVNDPAVEEREATNPDAKDLVVTYKSIKEAFLLESDYFDKDGMQVVKADEKRSKLICQIALMIARESDDPMYQELLSSTTLAKRLKSQIENKYRSAAEEKAGQLFSSLAKPAAAPAPVEEPRVEVVAIAEQPKAEEPKEVNELTEMVSVLNEGIVGAAGKKIVSFFVGFLSENRLDTIVNKAYMQAMSLAKTPEQKKKLLEKFKKASDLGDRKEKLAYVRMILNNAPEDKVAQAGQKMKQEMDKAKKKQAVVKESVQILNEAWLETWLALEATQALFAGIVVGFLIPTAVALTVAATISVSKGIDALEKRAPIY